MPETDRSSFCPKRLNDALSSRGLPHALKTLAEACSATTLLYDAAGQVLLGPELGNPLSRLLWESPAGRVAVASAHQAAAARVLDIAPPAEPSPLTGLLDYFALPLLINDRRAGVLTLGGRPRKPINPSTLLKLARTLEIDPEGLRQAVKQVPIWTAEQAANARELARLLGELFGELCAQDADLALRIEELSTVYSISGLVAGSLNLQAVLNRIAAEVSKVMKARACSIRILDEATGNLTIMAVHNLSAEYINKGPVNVNENPVDSAAIRGEILSVADARSDPRTRYPEQARQEGLVSMLVCGMVYRDKAVGVLRVYTDRPHVFTPYEESLLQAVANQAAAAIVNTRLLAETLEKERFARQLAYAGEVQRRMIPDAPPCCEGLDIAAVYRPTFQVGGDFYDFISLPNSNLGVAIADVSGKGVPASLQMASVRAALRVNAFYTYDIDRIMSEVNRHLCRDTTVGEFATAFYGVISAATGRLTYCNAGHSPPLLLRDGRLQSLDTGGMVLGVDPETTFERDVMDLKPGDVLMLFTDGAVDALNFSDEKFGMDRLAESLRRHADLSAQHIAQNILWDIRRFRGLADRTDDLTLVIIKVQPRTNDPGGRQAPAAGDGALKEPRTQ